MEDDESGDVDHLGKVEKTTALVILEKWRRRRPTPSDDDVTVQDDRSGSEALPSW